MISPVFANSLTDWVGSHGFGNPSRTEANDDLAAALASNIHQAAQKKLSLLAKMIAAFRKYRARRAMDLHLNEALYRLEEFSPHLLDDIGFSSRK